jgi:hypothetical protein
MRLFYLEQKMRDGGKLEVGEALTRDLVLRLLEERVRRIDWEKAKLDVIQFIRDRGELESWSKDFFLSSVRLLKCC